LDSVPERAAKRDFAAAPVSKSNVMGENRHEPDFSVQFTDGILTVVVTTGDLGSRGPGQG